MPPLTDVQSDELDRLYRTTKLPRLRTQAQMVLPSAKHGLKVAEIAALVREGEDTVARWLKRYLAEGLEGLKDVPRGGRPSAITEAHRSKRLAAVRCQPRRLDLLYSLWTLQRLIDYLADETGQRVSLETMRQLLKRNEIVLSRPQHRISGLDSEYAVKKTIEDTRDRLNSGDVFYYADEFNVSWLPTLKAIWSPKGQQIMIPTPGQPKKHCGLGAVNDHTGETIVLFRRRKCRREVAELLQALVDKHPTGVMLLEIKVYAGSFRVRGSEWCYRQGAQWRPMDKNPTKQAQWNRQRLARYLQDRVHDNYVPVSAMIALGREPQYLKIIGPTVYVAHLNKLTEGLKSYLAQPVLSEKIIKGIRSALDRLT